MRIPARDAPNQWVAACQFAGSWGHPFAGSWGQGDRANTPSHAVGAQREHGAALRQGRAIKPSRNSFALDEPASAALLEAMARAGNGSFQELTPQELTFVNTPALE
jgi:hypothetical protein